SIRLVTTGTMPQRAQVWNCAVRVPNAYLDMSEGCLTTTFSAPPGLEVHTPPCLVQNEQVHARAGISAGSGSQVRENEMFPQWHLPWINKGAISVVAAPRLGVADAPARLPGRSASIPCQTQAHGIGCGYRVAHPASRSVDHAP